MYPVYLLLLSFFFAPQQNDGDVSPLADYGTEWAAAKYNACNTAAKSRFMTAEEKQMIQIVNIARQHPALF